MILSRPQSTPYHLKDFVLDQFVSGLLSGRHVNVAKVGLFSVKAADVDAAKLC